MPHKLKIMEYKSVVSTSSSETPPIKVVGIIGDLMSKVGFHIFFNFAGESFGTSFV